MVMFGALYLKTNPRLKQRMCHQFSLENHIFTTILFFPKWFEERINNCTEMLFEFVPNILLIYRQPKLNM